LKQFEMSLTEGMMHRAVIDDSLPEPEVRFTLDGLRLDKVLDLGTCRPVDQDKSLEEYVKWLEYIGYREIKPIVDWKGIRDYGLSCLV
jgi:hypothetical protein